MPQDTRVGNGVCVLVHRKVGAQWAVLLGRRRETSPHAPGVYSVPGGWLELKETFELAALRELKEETGLVPGPQTRAELLCTLQSLHLKGPNGPRQSVNAYVWFDPGNIVGEPQLLEPEKCEGWAWYTQDALPSPLFPTLDNALRRSFRRMLHNGLGLGAWEDRIADAEEIYAGP